MRKFKVGDKVVITAPYQRLDMVGSKAIIVAKSMEHFGLDIPGFRGHSLGGRLVECTGYWVKDYCFKLDKVFKGNK